MGYYTTYYLEIFPPEGEPELLDKIVEAVYTHPYLENTDLKNYGLDWDNIQGSEVMPNDSVKWYDHDADMVKLSVLFPTVVFVLSGEGEEQGDIWKTMLKDGKLATIYAETTWPEFPPLKTYQPPTPIIPITPPETKPVPLPKVDIELGD